MKNKMQFTIFILKKLIKEKKESKFFSFNSIISTGGIALGVMVLILSLSILYGFEKTTEEKIIDFTAHITISGFGQRNLPFDLATIDSIKKVTRNEVASVSPFLLKNAIIKHKKFSEGLQIEGISPRFDNSNIKKFIVSGSYFSSNTNTNELIIGEKLASRLMIKVGNKVPLFTLYNDRPPSFENPPAIENFTVVGIYKSGMAEYDDLKAYTTLETLQRVTGLQKYISGYYLKLKNINKIPFVQNVLQEWFGYPYYVRSLYKTHANIFTWLELQKKPVPLILGLIVLVATFNIIGTLLMNVLQKTEAIGVLRTLGARQKEIRNIFLAQGLTYAVIGIILGNVAAYLLSWAQIHFNLISLPASIYFISSLPIFLDFKIYVIVSFVTLIVALLSSLIPAHIASKIEPVKALRFE